MIEAVNTEQGKVAFIEFYSESMLIQVFLVNCPTTMKAHLDLRNVAYS